MRAAFAVMVLGILAGGAMADDKITLKGEIPLDAGSNQARIALVLDHTTLVRGKPFDYEIRLSTTSGGTYFNLWFLSGLPMPGALAIFDANKRYLGDLLTFEGGSQAIATASNWISVPADRIAGTKLTQYAGLVPGTEHNTLRTTLPAGTYYLQLIVFKALVAAVPQNDAASMAFHKTFDRGEYFRSNPVTIELVDAPSAKK